MENPKLPVEGKESEYKTQEGFDKSGGINELKANVLSRLDDMEAGLFIIIPKDRNATINASMAGDVIRLASAFVRLLEKAPLFRNALEKAVENEMKKSMLDDMLDEIFTDKVETKFKSKSGSNGEEKPKTEL